MRIIFKDPKQGEIKLVAENLDDIWHLYNIIEEGDLVREPNNTWVHIALAAGWSTRIGNHEGG